MASSEIEGQLLATEIAEQVREATGLDGIIVRELPIPDKSTIAHLSPFAIQSDTFRVVRCFEVYGVRCFLFASLAQEGKPEWDVYARTEDNFQFFPNNPNLANKCPNESELENCIQATLLQASSALLRAGAERFHAWHKSCQEMMP